MEDKHVTLSDEVLIEIVHCIKDIVVRLIDHAFPCADSQIER